jgi:hypothetical protein
MEYFMNVHVADSRAELGQLAARDIGETLRKGLREKDHLRLILAAAPSQSEMLSALRREPDIDWQRVTAFHMDEHIELPEDAPQRFANWLKGKHVGPTQRSWLRHLSMSYCSALARMGTLPSTIRGRIWRTLFQSRW